ncbi:hypothetical protein CKAN_02487100 [Cinnamomum micranthum f. kanehirae]|uniref:THO1-MOS11 C-terminal domain-containing protein n=1 Tax=Cinnamomum micranthum f. kanehirae TaxID=337451 RepID=A0A3S3R7A9_9MAGN|nr:hypothetical protein CKAN_02487100 [Cinnamomum micranthum f. kanehirae]
MAMEMQKPKESSLPQDLLPAKPQLQKSENPNSHPLNPNTETPQPKQATKEEEEEEEEEEGPKEPMPPAPDTASDPVSDLQKKFLRAERFGMPVQLSEEEKRSSRAERFGTASTIHKSMGTGKSEQQKRKDRAERFGLAMSSTVDEEAKKKARLARFASNTKSDKKSDTKSDTKSNTKSDTMEEDKRKARAIRFSPTSPDTQSQSNGQSSELVVPKSQKTTTVDQTGGGT